MSAGGTGAPTPAGGTVSGGATVGSWRDRFERWYLASARRRGRKAGERWRAGSLKHRFDKAWKDAFDRAAYPDNYKQERGP